MVQAAAAQRHDVDERKRLGQYFTGEPLARVLAAIGGASRAHTVLDPMAGSGDMLVAARQTGATAAELTAVEIDPIVAALCAHRLRLLDPNATAVVADAFSADTWAARTHKTWDLVITNPPYVRYQRSTRRAIGRVNAPSAQDVRSGLLQIVEARQNLTSAERLVFCTLAQEYSGLADLAVPSWFLCATMVAPGGRLAMVVPDTWLSRDYALPVLYLLQRCFDVEYVIEDGEAAWFDDALVRTTLVVARRVEDRSSVLRDDATGYVHARLCSLAADHRSVVGALHPDSTQPDQCFAQMLYRVAESRKRTEAPGLAAVWVKGGHFRDHLLAQARRAPWLTALEPKVPSASGVPAVSPAQIPRQIREILGEANVPLCTLGDLGWQVGQGLRTGANRFFYGESVDQDDEATALTVDPALNDRPLVVPNRLLRVVVRKQQDLSGATGDPTQTPGRLLVLCRYALVEDIAATVAGGVNAPYAPLPEPLAGYVRRASRLEVGMADPPRRIPDLSAVITNVRLPDATRPNRWPRFWYHLPPFAPRHVGVLFLPRINHVHPLTTMNADGVVIDANFSTLWNRDDDSLSPYALLALLNSTWAMLAMETSGTVLGGGALKIEATQLSRLPLPDLTAKAFGRLDTLGHVLQLKGRPDAEMRGQIDAVVWRCLEAPAQMMKMADGTLASLLRARNPRITNRPTSVT